ncbi:hypothetical protein BDQ17DRAFT_1354009 [Cyathus striatus]|nr:hypothetical protein BDQ17DRAFT_1354009 [Cyathus striatus]
MTSESASSSSTPMVLTPESTGSCSPDGVALKKSRRQTAFYPNSLSSNKPLKPFSRSAAKRESVLALGSIEHLQYYFTKNGLAARKSPLEKKHKGLVPAIGGLSHIPSPPSIGSIAEFNLPPTPSVPSPPKPAFSPHVKTSEIDPETLLPGVIDDLISVTSAWRVDDEISAVQPAPGTHIDILDVLKTTTRAVRSIRNYVVSLPDESAVTIRAQFRPKNLGPSTSRPSTSSQARQPADPLTFIRKSALEVLAVLRDLEERCRLPLTDDAYDAQSDSGSKSPGGSATSLRSAIIDPDASVSFSLVQVQGRYDPVPVWDDDNESDIESEEELEKRERWDERLVLGSGWLYRQDVYLSELFPERKIVTAYLDVVDEVLFRGKNEGEIAPERGWMREKRKLMMKSARRRVSAGDLEGMRTPSKERGKRRMMVGMSLSEEPQTMEEIGEEEEGGMNEVDDDELPRWARRTFYVGDDFARAHALLSSFLPEHLQMALAPPTSRIGFLNSLSSGQLLCVSYNACVRKSKKPWGFVSPDGIHDVLALELKAEKEGDAGVVAKRGWTFRRTDNLRLWAGALKLRYLLPIQTPSQPSDMNQVLPGTPLPSPGLVPRFARSTEPPLLFDAKVVAHKDEGWEDMLEAVLLRWVQKAVEEKRTLV